MKAAAFDYVRPRTLAEAVRLLAEAPDAKILAGGQTLGPMLNLRLVQPSLVIDITRIPELTRVEDEGNAIVLGACVTHASIEDGRIVDPANGFLAEVAQGIAYRAVRSRGTVGGSLAHADPAADWLSCLTALGADILVTGSHGQRRLALGDFVRGAMATDLAQDEMIDGVRIPKLSKSAHAGYAKICRKAGEFAEAIGVAVHDPGRGVLHLVAGATQGSPILIDIAGATWPPRFDTAMLKDSLSRSGFAGDGYELAIHAVAIKRAIERAGP